jgi:hypothetical protein
LTEKDARITILRERTSQMRYLYLVVIEISFTHLGKNE